MGVNGMDPNVPDLTKTDSNRANIVFSVQEPVIVSNDDGRIMDKGAKELANNGFMMAHGLKPGQKGKAGPKAGGAKKKKPAKPEHKKEPEQTCICEWDESFKNCGDKDWVDNLEGPCEAKC